MSDVFDVTGTILRNSAAGDADEVWGTVQANVAARRVVGVQRPGVFPETAAENRRVFEDWLIAGTAVPLRTGDKWLEGTVTWDVTNVITGRVRLQAQLVKGL